MEKKLPDITVPYNLNYNVFVFVLICFQI